MGVIRDILSTALGSDQVKNGFNSRFSPSSNQYSTNQCQSSSLRQNLPNQVDYNMGRDMRMQTQSPNYASSRNPIYDRQYYSRQDKEEDHNYDHPFGAVPPYSESTKYQSSTEDQGASGVRRKYNSNGGSTCHGQVHSRRTKSRPLALPQIDYGDGQPFLRGYSQELGQSGISFEDFMQALDAINVAIIPNPEAAIFQKGANIAGWFLPGAASIGLTIGQIGVGLGTAMGHSSTVAKALSKANMEIFVPNGLEICIARTKDVDAEVGIAPSESRGIVSLSPDERVAWYGDLLAPLTHVLPPLQDSGRQDAIAALGQRFGDKSTEKKVRKAQKKLEKGDTKQLASLEGDLKWIMVRPASPSAMAHWQRVLQESDATLRSRDQVGSMVRR